MPPRRRAALPHPTATGVVAWRRAPGAPPLILGHRGARQRAPENTLAAFDLALDEGADGVELDVRLDGSGEIVVVHDRTLARVTQGADPRDVEELGTRELAAADVGAGQRVPELRQVLAWATARDARVNVELKADVSSPARLVARVAALIAREPDAERRYVLSSFHPGIVLGLARRLPSFAVGWLVAQAPRPGSGALPWRASGVRGLHPPTAVTTPALVEAVRDRGGFVNVWTVNDLARARDLTAIGVDALITDDPRGLCAARG
jgi:glycerophosphoryl diester phosphodiesterase